MDGTQNFLQFLESHEYTCGTDDNGIVWISGPKTAKDIRCLIECSSPQCKPKFTLQTRTDCWKKASPHQSHLAMIPIIPDTLDQLKCLIKNLSCGIDDHGNVWIRGKNQNGQEEDQRYLIECDGLDHNNTRCRQLQFTLMKRTDGWTSQWSSL